LIPRYTRQEMGQVWSDANKFAKVAGSRAGSHRSTCRSVAGSEDAAAAIRARAKVDVAASRNWKPRVKHDVIAFTMAWVNPSAIRLPLAGCTTA